MNTLLNRLITQAWFISPLSFAPLAKLALRGVEQEFDPVREAADQHENANWLARYVHQRKQLEVDHGTGIATISIVGPVAANLTDYEKDIGFTDLEDVILDIENARGQGAEAYFFDIDSPGGTVHGTPEAAAAISAIEEPTAAFTSGLMASAAYYLGAGVDRISASASAETGSIGVFIPWIDQAGWWEQWGVKWDPVVSTGSDLKAIGAGPSLEPQHRQYLQAVVDESLAEFKAHVLDHRGVLEGAMRGQCLRGKSALQNGLIDAVESRSQAYEALAARL